MPGPFDFLHLKSHTEGSSNELTFDVLEAMSSGFDAKDKKDKRDKDRQSHVAAKPSKGSYKDVTNAPTFSAVPEVTRRKRARRARTARSWIIVAVAIIALVGTGVFFGYRIHQDRLDFSARFGQLIDRFIEIDRTMVEVDSLMTDPLNSVESVERSEVAERFASLTRELNAVSAEAGSMEEAAQTDRDRAALAQAKQAASARADMIAAAESAFTLSKHANQLADAATQAWNEVLQADQEAREATELANKAKTEEATTEARAKTQEARNLMVAARSGLDLVVKEQPDVDLSAEKAYIDKRIESLDAALKTADALLANDRDAAKKANDAYNSADAAAATLAAELPPSTSEQVKAAFRSDVDAFLDKYADARAAVTAADSSLRAYL